MLVASPHSPPKGLGMPCLLVVMAFFAPRIVLAVLLVFSHFLETAYASVLWPLLGFFFMPVTTLAYAMAINWNGQVSGGYFVMVLIGALMDLGVLGGGVRTRATMTQL